MSDRKSCVEREGRLPDELEGSEGEGGTCTIRNSTATPGEATLRTATRRREVGSRECDNINTWIPPVQVKDDAEQPSQRVNRTRAEHTDRKRAAVYRSECDEYRADQAGATRQRVGLTSSD